MKPFKPELSQNEDATTTSAEITLGNYPHILVVGEGAATTYVKFGKAGSTTATSEDIPILSGMAFVFEKPDGAEVMAILSSTGTSRFGIIQGRHGV